VIVENGEGEDLLACDFDESFEVDLPELVGLRPLEALGFGGLGSGWIGDASMPLEDGGGGADGRRGLVLVAEVGDDLAGSPAVLVADGEDGGFESLGGAARGPVGFAGLIAERELGVEARQPLVSGLAGDPEVATGRGQGPFGGANGMDESDAKFDHAGGTPRHD
jgi:hypothetical protein